MKTPTLLSATVSQPMPKEGQEELKPCGLVTGWDACGQKRQERTAALLFTIANDETAEKNGRVRIKPPVDK